jgi:hypothetical protein
VVGASGQQRNRSERDSHRQELLAQPLDVIRVGAARAHNVDLPDCGMGEGGHSLIVEAKELRTSTKRAGKGAQARTREQLRDIDIAPIKRFGLIYNIILHTQEAIQQQHTFANCNKARIIRRYAIVVAKCLKQRDTGRCHACRYGAGD